MQYFIWSTSQWILLLSEFLYLAFGKVLGKCLYVYSSVCIYIYINHYYILLRYIYIFCVYIYSVYIYIYKYINGLSSHKAYKLHGK